MKNVRIARMLDGLVQLIVQLILTAMGLLIAGLIQASFGDSMSQMIAGLNQGAESVKIIKAFRQTLFMIIAMYPLSCYRSYLKRDRFQFRRNFIISILVVIPATYSILFIPKFLRFLSQNFNVGDVTATIPDQGLCQVGKRKHA